MKDVGWLSKQRDLKLSLVQTKVGVRQRIGADHLKAVTTRFVPSQHQGCRLKSILNDWELTLQIVP